jgi:hypothetical protein
MAARTLRIAFASAAVCASLTMAAAPAFAWGKNGHRIIGAIAEHNLSGEARARVAQILGNETFDEASTWADDMRSDPDPFWRKTSTPWHFVTVAGHDYDTAPSEGDALTALENFQKILVRRDATMKDRQMALRFIIHLVGDLHQPLHVGKGTDKGGNEVQVTFFGRQTNLHSVWDTELVEQEQLSFTEYSERLIRHMTNEDIIAWSDPQPRDWIAESAEIRDQIYPTDPKLSYDYVYRWKPTVERRLQQGGVRLAAYLNALLHEVPAPRKREAPAMSRTPRKG